MQKANATYVAPAGDNKVVEMGGVTFFDGVPVEINSYDHPHLIEKLQGNQHFDVDVSEDDEKEPDKPKRGRPSEADRIKKRTAEEQLKAQEAQVEADKASALKAAQEQDKADAAKKAADDKAEAEAKAALDARAKA